NEKKEAFEQKLEDTISTMSYKADDIIVTLERKLEELRKKNAELQKT
ncbi:MAG: YtxH domain-containing protein, partial [Eudoraea sp.]|nr:YtxH domain-containing protein [Eudoraea sp.]